MKAILDWAKAKAVRKKRNQPCIAGDCGTAQLADEQVNQKLAEMEAQKVAQLQSQRRPARRVNRSRHHRGEYKGWSALEKK